MKHALFVSAGALFLAGSCNSHRCVPVSRNTFFASPALSRTGTLVEHVKKYNFLETAGKAIQPGNEVLKNVNW